ncbi:hypothetical protein BCONGLO52_17780 [Brachybacterium conglomeratum]|uniref:Uncharacterized protein n=1 Tax=Brachybacterium conglomeratum TaxID=47846 RepID=A0ABQ5RHM4_9MICO|nr:hypothetical protein BCONGLO52_17780 [Brachybacterium conglomeratum]GLK05832.1 hypothetical protein GCM10017597_26320 [Brachybacterium conglomeratum]
MQLAFVFRTAMTGGGSMGGEAARAGAATAIVITGAAHAIPFIIERRVVTLRAVLLIGAPSNVPDPRLPPRSVQGPTPPRRNRHASHFVPIG